MSAIRRSSDVRQSSRHHQESRKAWCRRGFREICSTSKRIPSFIFPKSPSAVIHSRAGSCILAPAAQELASSKRSQPSDRITWQPALAATQAAGNTCRWITSWPPAHMLVKGPCPGIAHAGQECGVAWANSCARHRSWRGCPTAGHCSTCVQRHDRTPNTLGRRPA